MILPRLRPEEMLRAMTAYSMCRLSRATTMRIMSIDDVRVLHMLMSEADIPLPTVSVIYVRKAETWLPDRQDDE